MLQAKVTSCLTSCTEWIVSRTHKHTRPQLYSVRMTRINLPLTCETDWTQAWIELCSLPATVGGCLLKPFLFISLLIKVFCGEGNCDQAGWQQPSLPLTLQQFWNTMVLLCWWRWGGGLWTQIFHFSVSVYVCQYVSVMQHMTDHVSVAGVSNTPQSQKKQNGWRYAVWADTIYILRAAVRNWIEPRSHRFIFFFISCHQKVKKTYQTQSFSNVQFSLFSGLLWGS